jgi:hypothetical protein
MKAPSLIHYACTNANCRAKLPTMQVKARFALGDCHAVARSFSKPRMTAPAV